MYELLVTLALNDGYMAALYSPLRMEDRHAFPLLGDVHHVDSIFHTRLIPDRFIRSSSFNKATGYLLYLIWSIPLKDKSAVFRHGLKKTLVLGPDALHGSGGWMAVDLEFLSIVLRRGFYAARRD